MRCISPSALTLAALAPLAAFAVLAHHPTAQACSGCFTPSRLAPAEGVEAPANALGVVWSGSSEFSASDATLTDLDTGAEIPLDSYVDGFTFLVPAEPVAVGHQVRFTVPEDCDELEPGQRDRTLVAGAPVELPAVGLGTLVVTEPVLRSVPVPADISCTEDTDAVAVDVTLELAPELLPFADVLMYQTYVDGEPWGHTPAYFDDTPPGQSWRGRGEDRILALCDEGQGGSPVPRQVLLRARIPGHPEVSLVSDEVPIVLDCTATNGGADGSGTAGDGTAGTEGGSATTGASDDSGQDMDPGGCSCRSAGGSRPDAMAPLGLLLLLRRRRREQ